jgi:CHRD domain
MTRKVCLPVTAVALLGLLAVPVRGDGNQSSHLRAELSAVSEVPIVSSPATGSFRAEIAADGESFEYRLDYEGFDGTVTQSHIHIGQEFVAGGISVWLCETAAVPAPPAVAAITPTCGAPGGEGAEAKGTISAANVIGPTGQAVPAGAFAELIAMIQSGNAYVNVHSTSAPGGEVRGQIQPGRGGDD